jgi:hypothetical protein
VDVELVVDVAAIEKGLNLFSISELIGRGHALNNPRGKQRNSRLQKTSWLKSRRFRLGITFAFSSQPNMIIFIVGNGLLLH